MKAYYRIDEVETITQISRYRILKYLREHPHFGVAQTRPGDKRLTPRQIKILIEKI